MTVEASLKKQGSQVTVSYGLSDTGPYRINVALVQKEAHTAVKNGENGGRTLVNTNVVRQFKTVDNPAKSGTATLPIPNDLSTDQAAVLVYVQRTDNQQIVGAKLLQ